MKTTEQNSKYDGLEKMSVLELLTAINYEDSTVPTAVAKAIPQIAQVVEVITERIRKGGRVFYMGAGTSGRIGITDASEIPPTYGMYDTFIGIIAGGDGAIRTPKEGVEDNSQLGVNDIMAFNPNENDTLIGISASGGAPYVLGALQAVKKLGAFTSCITCNENSPLAMEADIPMVVVVGPEFVTGSTRMKSGSAAKLILNMVSTSVMIRLGHVRGNKMVDMQISNKKLVDRGTRMVMAETGLEDYETAKELLLKYGSVRAAVDSYMA